MSRLKLRNLKIRILKAKTLRQALVLIAGLTVSAANASTKVELIVWKTPESASPILLPAIEGESGKEAVERYLNSVTKDSRLAPLLEKSHLPAPAGNFQKLTEFRRRGPTRTAISANTFEDLRADGPRMKRVYDSFSKAGAEVYLIPIAADIGLTHEQAKDYRNLVAEQFSLLVSLGGQDIHPRLYNQPLEDSREVNYRRDRSEFLLVRNFKKRALGVVFGICRGHQMNAISDGHKLHQDLTAKGVGNTTDHLNPSGNNLTELQRWHHIEIDDSLLSRFLKTNFTLVNSLHHQSVSIRKEGASTAIARNSDVVEAIQGKNGLSLSVQFHPEFPEGVSGDRTFSENGFRILTGIVSYARLKREELRNPLRMCSGLFAAGS